MIHTLLRQARLRAKLTQSDLAEVLYETRARRGDVANIEAGRRGLSVAMAEQWLHACGAHLKLAR